ncbi:MAG: prepilin peptidase [Candidatus Sericytochromatia bacterium]|nr:prepilin peptidase [Candidatus Tanganyikabacteria bacterium]
MMVAAGSKGYIGNVGVETWKWGLVPILLVASYTDWRWQKIFNWLTFPAILAGFAVSATAGALSGGLGGAGRQALSSLQGFGFLALIFLVMALLGGMKGGDLKLMAAVGAWLGWPLSVQALLYVAICGGVFALAWAGAHGALGKTFLQIRNFFFAWQAGLKPSEMIVESAAPLFPYGISIGVGTLLAMLAPPLIDLGGR